MNQVSTSTAIPTRALKLEAMSSMSASFELFCLASGMEALGEMMGQDAQAICGPRHARGRDRRAHRWENEGQDRLPWRQGGYRAASASRLRRKGASGAELGSGGCGELAR